MRSSPPSFWLLVGDRGTAAPLPLGLFYLSHPCRSMTACPPHACPSHRVDNNHLLLLMIHVFRENEEQLFRVSSRNKNESQVQGEAGQPEPVRKGSVLPGPAGSHRG